MVKKALAKIQTRKVQAYPPIITEDGEEVPYIHKHCKECGKEYLTQLDFEGYCPKCVGITKDTKISW